MDGWIKDRGVERLDGGVGVGKCEGVRCPFLVLILVMGRISFAFK